MKTKTTRILRKEKVENGLCDVKNRPRDMQFSGDTAKRGNNQDLSHM